MRVIPEDSDEDSCRRTVKGMGVINGETRRRAYKEDRRIFEAGYVETKWLSTSVAAVPLLLFSDLSKCNEWSPPGSTPGSPHVERPIF